ncbi:MAG TPA: LPS biosynthesis glycosyltransferase, partial [Burkholderiales bacterium]|nr:LPS biosynthesis glycosyltransferase [Burkholderiales bacterium]
MNVAVFRALQLGDLLCAVPALRALRHGLPAARITLVGLPWARAFAARFARYVDDFIEFPGFPGLPERAADTAALPAFFAEARRRRYALAVQMHGSGELTNALVLQMGAGAVGGYYRRGAPCPDPERFAEWRDDEHEVLRGLRLVARLGCAPQGTALEFPLAAPDWREWRRFGLTAERYAVVHPGSQLASRRWPPERFAAVADAL